ncbi:uncharacterized protein LOC129587586 [Paramacrobiotus metropolitanus]|uniref:uncharacterized protein LOC129587586 n=1 Tax=Paramacrobiotus metropolitanus TaxID=2943436 RepID=UPI002445809D|nr:uncharacterized protein LOC129587586 [Paramacrobiotus metropolitanus]
MTQHVLCIAFPAFGHIIPLLELAKKMSNNFLVTFCVSEQKVTYIKERELLHGYGESIRMLGLNDGVNENFDRLVSPEQMAGLVKSMEQAQSDLLYGINPANRSGGKDDSGLEPVSMVITDSMMYVPLKICHERNIPCYVFNAASDKLMTGILKINPSTKARTSQDFHNGEANENTDIGFAVEEQCLNWMYELNHTWPLAAGVIHNSVREFEADAMLDFTNDPRFDNVPSYHVGPLLNDTTPGDQFALKSGRKRSPVSMTLAQKVQTWLDQHDTQTLIYVSFGTLSLASAHQTKEIAVALLSLQVPFIWSLRESEHQHLPADIQRKIKHQFDAPGGHFLVLPWVPQKLVLAHPATAVFVSHCGWNSTLEAVSSGVPVVAWPMYADQYMNAEFLEREAAAVKLEETGLNSTKVIAAVLLRDAITTVYGDKENENRYRKAMERLQTVAGAAVAKGGSSVKDLMTLMGI